MKRKFLFLWLMVLVILACNFPVASLPFVQPTATSTFTPSSTVTPTFTPSPTVTPTITPSLTPTPTAMPYPPVLEQPIAPGLVVRDLTYCINDIPLKMDVYFPQEIGSPAPALVYVHGGGWIGGDKEKAVGLEDVPALTAAGYLVAAVDYRRPPKYPFPDMVVDVKCAVRFLRARAAEFNIRPDAIGVWGSSAGGHIASLVGLADKSMGWDTGEYSEQSSSVRVVVDMFGPTDLKRLSFSTTCR